MRGAIRILGAESNAGLLPGQPPRNTELGTRSRFTGGADLPDSLATEMHPPL